jgi:hypothetical protein
MPVAANVPEPLRGDLERMEAAVQKCKQSLAFAAPEMQDAHWGRLQQTLADLLFDVHQRPPG